MRDATNLPRPSLLKNMWNQDFTTQGRAMSSRILCTDCHNSDKNREFGGNGANGPHGSANSHILERRYIMSKVNPGDVGGQIINLNANPILTGAGSPYALCAKCHDLNYINTDATWGNHSKHINKGVSCSVCHSSHGVPAGTSGTTGRAMISFDMNVVASNGGQPVSYNGSGCNLTCHGRPHTQN